MKLRITLTALLIFSVVSLAPKDALAVLQSLNGETGQYQTFQDDSNIGISSSNDVHALFWQGLLPISRGGTGASSFTNGSIPFISNGIFAEDNSTLFWDNINKWLGIGTSTPSSTLDVSGNATVTSLTSTSDSTINSITVGLGGGSISSNTTLGKNALSSNTTGVYNVAVGDDALSANTTDSQNTAVGYSALKNTTYGGGQNTAVGSRALQSITSGSNNTALGSNTLSSNITGTRNTAVGSNALNSLTSGTRNTAVGWDALLNLESGGDSTAFGALALVNTTSGDSNTAVGSSAMGSNTTGSCNTALGTSALTLNTTGEKNTAIGFDSLSKNNGSHNIAIGFRSGVWEADYTPLTSVNSSIYIGNEARGNNSDYDSIVMGVNAISAGANTTVIGNASMTDVYFGSADGVSNIHGKKLYLGSSSTPGCIVMGDSDGNGVTYLTVNDGVLTASTTPPSACQ